MSMRRVWRGGGWCGLALAALMAPPALSQGHQVVTVFDGVHMKWTDDALMSWQEGDLQFLAEGQAVERTIDLPPLPQNLRDAPGITIVVEVQPAMSATDAKRPGDPWTRLGSVGVGVPGPSGKDPRAHTTLPADQDLPGRGGGSRRTGAGCST